MWRSRVIDLSDIAIDDEAARTVAHFLRINKSVTTVDLARNHIGDIGSQTLCDALRRNEFVETLVLHGNQIGDAGAVELLHMLLFNERITRIDLAGNPCEAAWQATLSALCELNLYVATARVFAADVPTGGGRGLRASW